MRCIIAADIIEKKSHVMVLPADLVLYGDLASDPGTVVGADGENGMDIHFSANMNMNNADGDGMDSQAPDRYRRTVDALGSLADVHRREYRVGIEKGMPLAMSMLLADVGEEDEKGIPLKESAKVSMIHVGLIDGDVTATMLEYWWMDGSLRCCRCNAFTLIIMLILTTRNFIIDRIGEEGGNREGRCGH